MEEDTIIMVHLNHPCYEVDIQRDVSEWEAQMMERQGYIRLSNLREYAGAHKKDVLS